MTASRTWQRANTIPEMALVLSLVMLTLFGVFQYALVGFNQIGSDGAAFVGDHAAVAYYGGPTIANGAYAQQVGLANFPHSGANFNSSIPKSGTYEVDIASTQKAIGGMSQLFPATVSSTSRDIEPSQSVAASQGPPVGQCATGLLSATYNNTPILTSSAVGLLGNIPTDPIYQLLPTPSGTNALQFNVSALNNEDAIIGNVSTDLNNLATSLQGLSKAIAAINAIPLVGPPVAQQLTTVITVGTNGTSGIAPLVNSAVGGAYVSTGGGTTAGITEMVPLPATTITADVTATTNAVQQIESSNGLNALLTQTFTTILNPALTTVENNLTALNAAQTALNKLDNEATKCV